MSALALWTWSEATDHAAFTEAFAALPDRVRREPYRAALPPAAYWKTLLEVPRSREFWIVEHHGRAVGRVGALLSPRFAATGYLGFFEVDVELPERDRVAAMLLDVACTWLRGRGARRVYGPLDLATWFSYRFRVPADAGADENAEAPFAWEPVNPPEYVHWFAAHGFVQAERYRSQGFRVEAPALVDQIVAMSAVPYDLALAEGFAFRPFDATRGEAELATIHALSLEAFRDSFLFEPIPFATFRAFGAGLSARFPERFAYFALDRHGREVGFIHAFVDRGYAVTKTVAVRPPFRGRKLSAALMHLVLRDAAARGIGRGISALVRSGNPSELLGARHDRFGDWRHEYALFEGCL